MQQYNCQNGQSWYDVCLNTYGSLDYIGKLISDNGGEINVQPTTDTIIFWDESIVKDSSILSLIKNNGYIYNTSVSLPLPYIQEYSAGISPITFTPDGSNGWDLSVIANPTTVQIPSGETIDSCHTELYFWDAGSITNIFDNDVTVDTTINTGANGAGLYEILLTYNVSDGSTFQIFALYVVDATNTVLHFYKSDGVTVNSVVGLLIDVSADIDQSGSIANEWMQSDGGTPTSIGTGDDAVLTLLPTTIFLGQQITLDSNFNDYPNPTYLVGFSVTIN